jgi:hypothetical protein
MLRKSGNCIVLASANPRSPAGYESAALRFAGSWQLERRSNGQTVRGGPVKRRKRIAVGEKIPLELTERERDLIMKHTFAGNNLTDRLRVVPSPGQRPFYRFTLDDLDELAGYVAAEANHAKVKKLEKELRQLYSRIADALESYTDESDESAP